MNDIMGALTRTISISQFSRGLAGKIFEDIRKNGPKVVIKNNMPEAVILSPEVYLKEQEELENLRL